MYQKDGQPLNIHSNYLAVELSGIHNNYLTSLAFEAALFTASLHPTPTSEHTQEGHKRWTRHSEFKAGAFGGLGSWILVVV